ncbi:hypothetical protein MTR80_05640 [Alcaligenes aquatilis]|uniref:Uncharacterized protein n=1 Tax=Alcaligenes aquatilis TaxID=323284 RepID=A0ABY4NJF0_9BURK|nr:hypothetical protein MTR80_05640 [Alcaligenes aquatilis]
MTVYGFCHLGYVRMHVSFDVVQCECLESDGF